LLSDLRYAIRSLFKSPRFTIIALVVLALGIGANTAVFSVVDHVLLRPLAYPDSGRIVFIEETGIKRGGSSPTAPATYTDWRDQQHVFSSIAAAEAWGASLTGDGRPEEIAGLRVSPSLLDVLGVAPLLGRGLSESDIRDEAGRVVVIGYSLWQRRFGGNPGVIGRSITLNGAPYRIAGVMPRDFRFPPFWQVKAEMWTPLVFSPQRLNDRNGRSLRVFARLKDGVAIERASAEMVTIARRLEAAYPDSNADRGASVRPLQEVVVGKVQTALYVLLGAVVFLLLIACANVANLLLSRATARRREMALRIALGAARGRLVRQLVVENLVLALAGGALGIFVASAAVEALRATLTEASRFTLPRYQEIGLDGRVLLFAFGVSVVTGILFGLAPALQFSRPDLHGALKQGTRGGSQASGGRMRPFLVAGEIAISLMLLAGAGLMIRSFARLGAVDSGFEPHHVLTMRVVLTGSPQAAPERRNAFYRQVLDGVSALPGIESASGINHLPLAGDQWTFSFTVDGQPAPPRSDMPHAVFRTVFPGYFRTMRVPLLQGRDIATHDDASAPRVVVINQTMASRYWPNQDAVGKGIHMGGDAYTVVGVVKDTEQESWGAVAESEFYFSQLQNAEDIQRYLTLVVRTAGDPASAAAEVQSAVWSLDRDLPISDILTMQQVVERAVWQPRFSTTLLGAFAGLALLLAAVGVYGVMAYDVGRRTPEIGIRMALGARPADVLGGVLASGMRITAAGAAAGIAGALVLTRYLQTMLFEVSATDPEVLFAAALILGAVAMAAAWIPARQATRVDPMIALRSE
jgi:putative ABC transport system permease protein